MAEAAEFQITEQTVADNVLTMKVEVDREVVSGAFKRVHRAIANQVKVPGFRAGKVPMPVLVNYIGKDTFLKEVRRELLPHYYYDAVESLSQRPISGVTYEDEALAQGEPFSFRATVDVAPRVELGDYESLEVEKVGSFEVSDEEVEARLQALNRRFAKTEAANESELGSGQMALVNIDVEIEGQSYQTLGRRNHSVEIGREQYMAGFDEKLIGHRKGDEFSFEMNLVGEHAPQHLAGKPATFKVQLKAVRNFKLPEIADEWAKDLGFRDLAALRDKLRADALEEKREKVQETAETALKKALSARVGIELPALTVEKRVAEHMDRLKERVNSRGLEFDAWIAENGKSEDLLKQEAAANIAEELKLEFALDAVADHEKISVTDKDVEHRIAAMARALGKRPEDIIDALDQSGSRILTKQDIARERALAMLKKKLLGLPAPGLEEAEHSHDHEHDEDAHGEGAHSHEHSA